jgi:CRP/FNR family transcriptional regulator, anaerobic regulatory protein
MVESFAPTAEHFSGMRQTYQRFTDVYDRWFNEFCALCTGIRYPKGTIVLQPESVCTNVYYVYSGMLMLYYDVDGKYVSEGFFAENTIISEYSSFTAQIPAMQGIIALEQTEVLAFSHTNMQWLYTTFPETNRVGRLVAEALFSMVSFRNSIVTLKSPEERYRMLFANAQHVLQRVPQYLIASYLNITPEALSRIRKRMR